MSDILDPITRLTRDLKKGALTLGDHEARFLVDTYYIIQDDRKRSKSQFDELNKSGEPNTVIEWLFNQHRTLEDQIKLALDLYTESHYMGSYMRSIYGIGPVISAGLLAHIDITKAPTVGHIWHYAGIAGDDQRPWLKGQKRPFNAQLKVLCYKAGDSFIKFSNDEKCYYGHVYKARKVYEVRNNSAGILVEQAVAGEARMKNKSTEVWAWYAGCYPAEAAQRYADIGESIPRGTSKRQEIVDKLRKEYLSSVKGAAGSGQPMLPPGHINSRARRYAVKLFLSHLHDEWFRRHFKTEPPLPYPIAHLADHTHFIPPPSDSACVPPFWL